MFQFLLANKADLREEALIQQKRRFENDRKSRIFNARTRTMGVDLAGLDAQIKEKLKIQHLENERQSLFDAEEQRKADLIKFKTIEIEKERNRIEMEINNYRKTFQKKEDAREFDLNDPKRFQKCLPARVGDNDPRLSISSAQKFLGEDLMSPERIKAQKDQQRAWLQLQINERKQAEAARKEAERYQEAGLKARDRMAVESDAIEKLSRRQIQSATARYNKELAAEQECKRLNRKREDEEDNLAEMYNLVTSDMLTENRNCTDSNFGQNRKITTNYRGLTDEEVAEFQRGQTKQFEENGVQAAEKKSTEVQWDRMDENIARVSIDKEREYERRRSALRQKLRQDNAVLATEQNARNQYMEKIVFTNPPTAEYFAQFNTLSR